jgi:tRNA(Ile)-lysidine synthase
MQQHESLLVFSRSGLCSSFKQVLKPLEKKIILACSGGPDSAVLMGLSAVLVKRGIIERAEVVHVNHNLRSEASEDLNVCKRQADRFGMPFFSYDIFPSKGKKNLYALCREMRYRAIQDHAASSNSDVIVTAHHADDVAETLIMNLARGCGEDGLCSIRERNNSIGGFPVIRPLLKFRKMELQNLCESAGLEFAVDKSNFNQEKTRSFIRHSVIPMLEKVNPAFVKHASKTALIMQKNCR